MDTARHRGTPRKAPIFAVAGLTVLGLAAAGTLFTVSPAHASTPAAQPVAPSFSVGLQPIDVAVATYAHRAYVATDSYVDVVDTTSHQRVTMVSTGLTDQTAISVVRAGAKFYVGSFADSTMAILDPATDTVTGTVKVGKGTTDITDVVTPKGEFAYLTQYGKHTSRVTVVDARTDQVVNRFHVAGDPVTATQSPNLEQVWVGTARGENVAVVDAATQKVVRTIPMPRSGPVGGIAFGPRGNRAFVTGLGGLTSVQVRTARTQWFMSAPRLFPHAGGINTGPVAVGPRGTLMVVNSTFPDSPRRGTVTVLERSTRAIVSRTRLGVEPTSLAVDAMGRQALFTNYGGASVSYVPLGR